jgi:hypothetical protein
LIVKQVKELFFLFINSFICYLILIFYQVVDEPAAISESNKGYKLLQKMGWNPGEGRQPIIPVKLPNKQGLGFSTSNQTKKSNNT